MAGPPDLDEARQDRWRSNRRMQSSELPGWLGTARVEGSAEEDFPRLFSGYAEQLADKVLKLRCDLQDQLRLSFPRKPPECERASINRWLSAASGACRCSMKMASRRASLAAIEILKREPKAEIKLIENNRH